MLTLALVGTAHIHTPGFVKRLNARDGVRVKYVWDWQPERARKWAAELNTQTVDDLQTIWNDAEISAVIICSETDRHEALVLAAAAAKKHMFVEKPLGMGADDAYQMAQVIESAGLIFQTGYFMRSQGMHRFLREQIQAGHFGRITRVRMSNCHSGSLGGWFDTDYRWMADPKIAGCGAFGDLGTHRLDIMLWLIGDPVSVTADVGIATARYGDCDEYGEGLLKFASGTIGVLAGGWVDLADPVPLLISGTEGHACICNGQLYFKSNHVEGADGKEPWANLPADLPHAFELFLDALLGQDVPLIGAREAAVRSAVMEALYKAAQTKTWVTPK
ncbi:MAG: Gfo/Idh/MocA family oxidoreductase [Anaerolineae bacterium]|nr:Gfo/Idh/MocA family oxidoreductase [Anaerolineae bacterium]